MKKKAKKTARKISASSAKRPSVRRGRQQRVVSSKKRSKALPGYPHYPQTEDILSPLSPEERIDADVEALSNSPRARNVLNKPVESPSPPAKKTNPDFVPGTEADVTQEDVVNLGNPDW